MWRLSCCLLRGIVVCCCISLIVFSVGIAQRFSDVGREANSLLQERQQILDRIRENQERDEQEKRNRTQAIRQQRAQHALEKADAVPIDYQRMPLLPTEEELNGQQVWQLRPNRLTQSYRSFEQYIDTHFKLMREDCFRPLCDLIGALRRGEKIKKLYTNVRVLGPQWPPRCESAAKL